MMLRKLICRVRRCDLLNLTSCTILKNGQDARSTRDEFSACGTGILPVHKRTKVLATNQI